MFNGAMYLAKNQMVSQKYVPGQFRAFGTDKMGLNLNVDQNQTGQQINGLQKDTFISRNKGKIKKIAGSLATIGTAILALTKGKDILAFVKATKVFQAIAGSAIGKAIAGSKIVQAISNSKLVEFLKGIEIKLPKKSKAEKAMNKAEKGFKKFFKKAKKGFNGFIDGIKSKFKAASKKGAKAAQKASSETTQAVIEEASKV